MKDLRESLTSNPSSFMQSLMQYGVTADDVLVPSVEREQKQLEDRDMVSLMHVLSRAADLPSTANHSQRDAKRLSQSFITIADSLISQDNVSKWNSIKE
ncbi:hypothetical protein M9458_018127, partial [Cirrhinus mrigala]